MIFFFQPNLFFSAASSKQILLGVEKTSANQEIKMFKMVVRPLIVRTPGCKTSGCKNPWM